MSFRCCILPFLLSISAIGADQSVSVAHNQGTSLSAADAASMETALAANPEDLNSRMELVGFYATSGNDLQWSNRYRLLSWVVEHHPESSAAGLPSVWRGMPAPIFDQLKPVWVAQVHQHAEDAQVLNNASVFLSVFLNSKNASSGPPSLIRVGGKVQEANLIHSVDPVYPSLAAQARVQGTVRFNVTVGTDGYIEDAQLISGHPLLIAAAQQAVQEYLYKPTLLNGKPVSVVTTVDVNFSLNH